MLRPIRVLILDICSSNPQLAITAKDKFLEKGCVVMFTKNRSLFEYLASGKEKYNFAVIFIGTEEISTINPSKFALSTTIITPQSFSYKKISSLLQAYT